MEKIFLVMKNGKKIELEKKKDMKYETWLNNCINFFKENQNEYSHIEDVSGNVIKSN